MISERIFPAWSNAERLEASLGDPFTAASPLSFARAMSDDELEAYPEAAIAALHERGYQYHFVPSSDGGRLTSLEEALALVRVVSRRDLTVAIALGQTFLGSVPVWLGGDSVQRADAARLALSGAQMALALTEEPHGADLLACEVRADVVTDGYRLDGTKWLINNGTRGSAFSVFVRTDSRGGPRGFSLLFVKRPESPSQGVTSLEKLRTHGIRGADISGLRFENAEVARAACLGQVGSGLELLLKALQITRTGCTAFSLGAADTALRLALDFVRTRTLYGAAAWQLPHVRSSLVDAFLDLLIAEAVTLTATRVLHVAPEQAPVSAAVAKYQVPVRLERVVRELGTVIGARHYLRQGLAHGVFQKIARDVAVVSLFDGSAAVNLDTLSSQIPSVLRRPSVDDAAPAVFALDEALPPLNARRFSAFTTRDDVMTVLRNDRVLTRLDALAVDIPAAAEAKRQLAPLMEELASMGPWLDDFLKRAKLEAARSAPMLDAARRYTDLWAAAALVQLWLHNRERGGPFLREGAWLGPALARLNAVTPRARPAAESVLADHLVRLHDEGRAFSFVPIVLPPRS